jgi:hypothetical protein
MFVLARAVTYAATSDGVYLLYTSQHAGVRYAISAWLIVDMRLLP